MVRVGDEYGIRALDRYVGIVGFAQCNFDVALTALEGPEPQKYQGQPTDVLRQNSAALANQPREFDREVSRPASQIDNYVSGPQIECLDNIGRPLPLIPLSFNHF